MKTKHYPHLQALLRSRNPAHLAEGARLAEQFDLADLVPLLQEVAVRSPYYTKTKALFALDRLAPEVALNAAEEVWENPRVPDDFYWHCARATRASAALILSKAGKTEGTEFLRGLLASRDVVVTRWLAPALLQPEVPGEIRRELGLDILADQASVSSFSTPPYSEPGQLCLLCEALGHHTEPGAIDLLTFYAFFHSRFVRMSALRALERRVGRAAALSLAEKLLNLWSTPSDLIERAALAQETDFLVDCARSPSLGDFEKFQAVDRLSAFNQGSQTAAFLSCSWAPVRQRAIEALASAPSSHVLLAQQSQKESEPLVLAALEAATSRQDTL